MKPRTSGAGTPITLAFIDAQYMDEVCMTPSTGIRQAVAQETFAKFPPSPGHRLGGRRSFQICSNAIRLTYDFHQTCIGIVTFIQLHLALAPLEPFPSLVKTSQMLLKSFGHLAQMNPSGIVYHDWSTSNE